MKKAPCASRGKQKRKRLTNTREAVKSIARPPEYNKEEIKLNQEILYLIKGIIETVTERAVGIVALYLGYRLLMVLLAIYAG